MDGASTANKDFSAGLGLSIERGIYNFAFVTAFPNYGKGFRSANLKPCADIHPTATHAQETQLSPSIDGARIAQIEAHLTEESSRPVAGRAGLASHEWFISNPRRPSSVCVDRPRSTAEPMLSQAKPHCCTASFFALHRKPQEFYCASTILLQRGYR